MIKTENFKFIDRDGTKINCYKWYRDQGEHKAIIQISHGMSENIFRYDEFARFLAGNGYIVYGHDHRGHGETANTLEDIGYMSNDNNFTAMVDNLRDLNQNILKENKSLPIILFGHSMGSFISQRYIQMYGNELSGVILSGTNGKHNFTVNLGIILSAIETKLKGRKHKSKMMDKLSFGGFNRNIDKPRTNFDWLSRDEKEVDKYIENQYCGIVFSTSYFHDFTKALKYIQNKGNLNKIPKNLPIYIFAGDNDPVGYKGKGIINLYNTYKKLGIKNVSYKLYKDGRHEMLNEINKKEVMEDTIKWINSII